MGARPVAPRAVRDLLWNLVRGNFGVSISTRQPVWLDLRQTFPATIELAVVAMALSILVGIPLGVLSAVKRDGRWTS